MGRKFLDRNKRKGSLAALLLLLRREKGGLGAIVAIFLLLSLVFVAPSDMVGRIPFIGQFLGGLGLHSGIPGSAGLSFQELAEALRDARFRDNMKGRLGWGARGGMLAMYGKDTMDLVKGGKGLKGRYGNEDHLADSVKKTGGKSIDGVLTPEDAKKRGEGVSLSDSEMENGLLKSAFAGKFADGAGGGRDLEGHTGAKGGNAVFSSRMGLSGGGLSTGQYGGFGDSGGAGKAVNAGQGAAAAAMASAGRVPSVGRGSVRMTQTAGGNVSWKKFSGINARMGRALSSVSGGNGTAMQQVAEAHAYGQAGAPSHQYSDQTVGMCESGSCPGEFASASSGSTFDGGRVTGDFLEGASGGVDVPDQADIDSLIDEANQMEEDAKKCEEAEKTYGPQERSKMDEMQDIAEQAKAINAAGCDEDNEDEARRIERDYRRACREYNVIARNKANACPLQDSWEDMDCEQQ